MDERDFKQLNADLKDVNDKLKAYAEDAAKLAKEHKALSAEAKESVDKLLSAQTDISARIQELEQTMASGFNNQEKGKPQTYGDVFMSLEETEPALAKLAKGGKGSYTASVQAALTNDIGLAEPQRVPGIVTPPERRLTIRDLLTWGRTSTNSIEYVKETGFTNNADVVSENPSAGKPESTLTFEVLAAPIATIAHWVHASKQVLSDVAMLQSYLSGRLVYGLKLKEEAQLLKGSGVGLNINGLYTQASNYLNPGVTVANETGIDRLRIAMLQVQLAEYDADAIVLNPIDWANIELTKDSMNRYILANPFGVTGAVLWGKPVVPTQAMGLGEFLTGAFAMGAQGWDREDISVTIATQDQDDFIKNMVKILVEERVGLTVYRPEAFVKGDFSTASSI
jgi:HK97 family phage major capsid protein